MQFKFFFYFNHNTNYDDIYKNFSNLENYRFVTNRTALREYFQKKNKHIMMLDDIKPEHSIEAYEVYNEVKKILVEYETELTTIEFNNITVFSGFEYYLLRTLTSLIKAKKILELRENVIFIFEDFNPNYLSIAKLAKEFGYESDENINLISGQNIKIINSKQINGKITRKTYSLSRAKNYLRSSSNEPISIKKILTQIEFLTRLISFGTKLLRVKLIPTKSGMVNNVLKSVDKKMLKLNPKLNAKSAFFITGVREDLYLRSWYNVWKIFKKNKTPFLIISSDFSTSMTLSKAKLSFLDLFEDVNLLENNIPNIPIGTEIKEKFDKIIGKGEKLLAINDIAEDILGRIYRAISIIIILEHILKKLELESIVGLADGEMLECIAIEEAKKHKISSYSIMPAMVDMFPLLSDWFHAEHIFLQGKYSEEILLKADYAKNRLTIVGNPKLDHFKSIKQNDSIKKLQSKYNIAKNHKLVVIAMSQWHQNDEIWMSDLIHFCNSNEIETIIKVHPRYKLSSEINDRISNDIEKKCKGMKYKITHQIDLYTLLSASDLVISEYSNAGIEAVLLEKPLIIANFSKIKSESVSQRMDKLGAALYTEDYEELEKLVKEILFEKKYLEDLKNGRRQVNELFNFKNDGKASNRIYDLLIKNKI